MKKNNIATKATKEIKDSKKIKKDTNKKMSKKNKNILQIVLLVIIAIVIILAIYFFVFFNKENSNTNGSGNASNSGGASGTVSDSPFKSDNVKVVTLKGNAEINIYDSNNILLKNMKLDSEKSIENYGTFYAYKNEGYIEANINEKVKNIKITGSGMVSLWIYLVDAVDGPTIGYELNDVNIDGKELIVDSSFKVNEKPVFKLGSADGSSQVIEPIVIK